MDELMCNKCKKKFSKKQNYLRHINRLNDCVSGSKTKRKLNYHSCEKCKKKFNRKDSLRRHLKICKYNKTKNKIKGDNNNNNVGNKNININIDNSPNSNVTVNKENINVNIILLNYPPDKYTLAEDIGKILADDKDFIIKIVERTNVNKDKPEHHNIYYPDIKSAYGEMYKNNRWNTMRINEILHTILECNTDALKQFLNELGDIMNEKTKNNIMRTVEDFYNTDRRQKMMSYIKCLLYDNREMIRNTRKKVKKYNSDKSNKSTESDTIDYDKLSEKSNEQKLKNNKSTGSETVNSEKSTEKCNEKSKKNKKKSFKKKIIYDSNSDSDEERC